MFDEGVVPIWGAMVDFAVEDGALGGFVEKGGGWVELAVLVVVVAVV